MGEQAALFDAAPYEVAPADGAPVEKLSADRRRTQRQREAIAAGRHPLQPVAGRGLKLHPEAAPHDDPGAPGRRCGNCWYRRRISTGSAREWPKCLYGTENPTDAEPYPGPPPRVTRSAASDVRRWWPACTDHSYGDPAMSDDAARYVPAPEPEPEVVLPTSAPPYPGGWYDDDEDVDAPDDGDEDQDDGEQWEPPWPDDVFLPPRRRIETVTPTGGVL